MNTPPTLFLHWGPGGHARDESQAFSELRKVRWWDQPALEGTPHAYRRLIEASADELLNLAKKSPTRQVRILAHSFGGQLARELAELHPSCIASITLLSANEYSPDAFLNLAKSILKGKPDPELQDAWEKASRQKDWPALLDLINRVTRSAGLLRRYWGKGSEEIYNRHLANHPETGGVDTGTFLSVYQDYFEAIKNQPLQGKSPYQGPVTLLFGEEDVLTIPEHEISAWSRSFPQLQAKVFPRVGHFIQFETPAERWLPAD